MKPYYERRQALPRRRFAVEIELTPEEYEALVTAVIAKRQAEQDALPEGSAWRQEVIARDHPLIHHAVRFDVQGELMTTILKFIGHEGRPTLAAQYERMHAEIAAERAAERAQAAELVSAA